MSTSPSANRDQPFGDENASHMGPGEILRGFYGFDADERVGGLGVTDADSHTRIFIGGRGSGRSTYLGRAHAAAAMSGNVYVLPMGDHSPPDSDTIRFLCEAFAPADVVKGWQLIWRAAIVRSVTSHLLYNYDLGRPLEDTVAGLSIAMDFNAILQPAGGTGGECLAPAGVYSQVTAIAETFRRAPAALTAYLRMDHWDKLEGRIAEGSRGYRQVGVYLDGLDREFRHAPLHWLTCEKGLFYQVLHFSENQLLSERVRIVASIRDLTYSMVREGDSPTRYPPRGRIRHLGWTPTGGPRTLARKDSAVGQGGGPDEP